MNIHLKRHAFAAASIAAAAGLATAQPSDDMLEDRVDTEISLDADIGLDSIDVRADNGIVTLDGSVDTLADKHRAIRLTQAVRGTTGVIDDLAIVPWVTPTDTDLETDIRQVMAADAAIDGFDIDIEASDGIVTISGAFDSTAEERVARSYVANIPGVVGITSTATVATQSYASDSQVEARIRSLIDRDVLLERTRVSVEVSDGEAFLSGTVGSLAEKERAIECAASTRTDRVDASELTVKPWLDNPLTAADRGTIGDSQIENHVTDALDVNPRTSDADLDVRARDGVVTIRGDVSNLLAKREATETARNVVGVSSVRNLIDVTKSGIDDETIEADVEFVLTHSLGMRDDDLDASVYNGIVTLSGSADTLYDKSRAMSFAAGVEGVRGVRNKIYVEPGADFWIYDPYVDDVTTIQPAWKWYTAGATIEADQEVAANIGEEIFWSPFVDSDDVSVTVSGGTATLRGEVDSWSERQAAIENAYEGGAEFVVNNLTIAN